MNAWTQRLSLGGLLGLGLGVQATPAEQVYTLGTITVSAPTPALGALDSGQVASVLTSETLRRFDRDTLGEALDLLSGVSITTNSRNEQTLDVRGFDARQVPIFIDGIPVSVPYDGYLDLGRFTTTDLSAIQVAKGFSAMAYGANTLGGAINLVSRRPERALEGDLSIGLAADHTRTGTLNLGTNQGQWYLQFGASWRDSDGFPLSDDFQPTATEDGGRRDNSDQRDAHLSLKLGWTPRGDDEYAISYYRQHATKGQPPSTDARSARYWRWPYWDKEGVYVLSRTALGEHERLRLRLYLDDYDNAVDAYTDASYTTRKTAGRGSLGPSGRSIYDDRVFGGSITLESTRLDHHQLQLALHHKHERHHADDTIERTEAFEDALDSIALEDSITLGPRLRLALGLAHHRMRPLRVDKVSDPVALPEAQSATDAQAGLFWSLDPAGDDLLYATVARKSRFPTLKDRYSLRLDTAIPNPDLRTEHALNYELGYRGSPRPGLELEAALFASSITDLIQRVDDVEPDRYQMQNVGEVQVFGLELGAEADLGARWQLGAHLTLIDRDNRSDPDRRLTGVPSHKLTAHARFIPAERWETLLYLRHEGARWSSDSERLDAFTTLDLKLAVHPASAVTLAAGVRNLADSDYAPSDGYPAAGRTWFVEANYRF
ncbi:TonB-dependent receptor plug domain-containing protein [Marichromatium gracile]|uniref:TonB-dependent receptor plug domain-containing protein n=1 Tax=Marichromatium gracile TaxID=1048 RepID=UPI0009EF227C|nr:TonB-dependent receptor [Marichromatium gracile]